MRVSRVIIVLSVASVCLAGTATAAVEPRGHSEDTRVSVGSPATPFSQNKQNEPSIAVDPTNPWLLIGASNDQIDFESCAAGDPTTCTLTPGVGLSGIELSVNGGRSWHQPTYTGWSARHCLGPEACVPRRGPIGTLPHYDTFAAATYGDPEVAFGPRPGRDGKFSWRHGSRAYYAGMVRPFPGRPGFRGHAAITVSHLDATGPGNKLRQALAGDNSAWSKPALASDQKTDETHAYKPQIWSDNAATSPHFGNVYVCSSAASTELPAPEQPIQVGTSTDGGVTWRVQEVSPPSDNTAIGCAIRTDSKGNVYVVWIGSSVNSSKGSGWFYQSRSRDGGRTFEPPRPIVRIGGVGGDDPVLGGPTSDGVAGSQTHRLPSIDIANGAPSGRDATDEIIIAFVDNSAGYDKDNAYLVHSRNRGQSYTGRTVISESEGRANFAAIAISPDGEDVYLVYNAILAPWRTNTADPRPMRGVVRHANSSSGPFRTLHRGAVGDTRGAGSNGLTNGFIGDYNYAVATRHGAVFAWVDMRGAEVCPAVQAFRQSLVDGTPIPRPAAIKECPRRFGNTDTWGIALRDPTRD